MHFSLDPLKRAPMASADNPVVEIMCLWESAEGTGLDGLPCRGFAGQILFFTRGKAAPARVEGNVRIYVFDDQGTPEEQEEPIHQFDFDNKSLQTFLTETNIGAAYQLFIPYTRKGGQRTTCSLRVRLSPSSGSPTYSKMASVILPGTNTRKPDEPIPTPERFTPQTIDLANYETSTAASAAPATSNPLSGAVNLASPVGTTAEEDRQRLMQKLHQLSHSSDSSTTSPSVSTPVVETNTALAPTEKKHPLSLAPALGTAPVTGQMNSSDPPRHPLLED